MTEKIKEIIDKVNKLEDPSFKLSLEETKGVVSVDIVDDSVVHLEIALRNRKKDEQSVKIQVVKIIKLELGYPGVRIVFTDNKMKINGENNITYFAIASGKGGVGKSSVTALLAIALDYLGYQVGVIDCDVYGSSIPTIFDLPILPLATNENDDIVPFKYGNIEVVSTEFFMPKDQPMMWRGPMLGKVLTHFFDNVSWDKETKYILIDLPPGTGDVHLDLKEFMPDSKFIIVTTPNHQATHVAKKAGLGAIEMGQPVIGVIENMSYLINEETGERQFIFGSGGGKALSDLLDVPLLGQLLYDTKLGSEKIIPTNNDMLFKLMVAIANNLTKL